MKNVIIVLTVLLCMGITTKAQVDDWGFGYDIDTKKEVFEKNPLSAGTYLNRAGNCMMYSWMSAAAGSLLLWHRSENILRYGGYPENEVKGLAYCCFAATLFLNIGVVVNFKQAGKQLNKDFYDKKLVLGGTKNGVGLTLLF